MKSISPTDISTGYMWHSLWIATSRAQKNAYALYQSGRIANNSFTILRLCCSVGHSTQFRMQTQTPRGNVPNGTNYRSPYPPGYKKLNRLTSTFLYRLWIIYRSSPNPSELSAFVLYRTKTPFQCVFQTTWNKISTLDSKYFTELAVLTKINVGQYIVFIKKAHWFKY